MCRKALTHLARVSVGSQSPQPHLEDGTTYHPLWPTTLTEDNTGAALRCGEEGGR